MPQPADERRSLVIARGVEGEDDELVAADTGDSVARPHDRFEALGERTEHIVAGAVTADVVHFLEAVQVDNDQGEP